MGKPIKKLIYKLVITIIFLIISYYAGWIDGEKTYGMVIPSLCTVYAVLALINCIRQIRKSKDQSKVEFL